MRATLNFWKLRTLGPFLGLASLVLVLVGCASGPDDLPPSTGISGQENKTQSSSPDVCDSDTTTARTEIEQSNACLEGETEIVVKHSPLFRPEPHTSVITATASNSGAGIDKVLIYVIKGQMTDCQELGGDPSVIPCRSNAVVLPAFECDITNSKDPEACEMSIEIVDGDMVTYVAVARPVSGADVASSAITYAGGLPSVDVAMPVWWHTEIAGPNPNEDRLNLALFIDPDFGGDLLDFGTSLSEIAEHVFFTTSQVFAKSYTRNRNYFDIWAFPFEGALTDPEMCNHEFRANAATLDGLVDGSAILHVTEFTDCASIGPEGAGSVGVEESRPDWILVHESGHFLFGLADEYGKGGQVAGSEPPNVFSTLGDCQVAAPLVGAYPWLCYKFGSVTETYRIQTSEPETMRTQDYTSDFYNSSAAAISARIEKCTDGKCF